MANVFGTNSGETIDAWDGVTNSADNIFGLGGNDLILGGLGADTINGGSGTDTSSYSDSSEGVIVSLITNAGFGGTAEGDSLSSIENLTGSAFGDFLVGNDAANVLTGLEGQDTLKGGGGADTLYGDSGNDMLKGGGGADTLNGGSGIDTANYAESGAAVFISLYNDVAAYGDAEGDELNSIENVTGSAYGDDLWGNDGVNVLSGQDGDDTLKGFGGADTINGGNDNDHLFGMDGADILNGGNGNDELNGGANNDTLNGGAGNDTIIGGMGVDFMTGGAGLDSFVFTDKAESAPGAMFDQITDFTNGWDLIDLSAIDADTSLAGNQAFTFIPFGQTPTAGTLTVNNVAFDSDGDGINDKTFANVNFYVDGDATPDFALGVVVNDLVGLVAVDFVL